VLNTIGELTQLFKTNAALLAAGGTYDVQLAEVWNIGTNIAAPALNFTFAGDNRYTNAGTPDRESGELTIWFLAKSETDAWKMRDALFTLLHEQQNSLATSGVLHVQKIMHTLSHVGKAPNTGVYQAYMTFRLVV